LVTADAYRITFDSCRFESNSVTKGSGIAHGLETSPSASYFTVVNCVAQNGLYTGTQGYGIAIGASASNFIVSDNVLLNNGSGALYLGAGATGANIDGNLGYNFGQVSFPATQNASSDANTLDDYEENTWTPTVSFDTPGDLSVAYSVQSGIYTKIGRLVNVSFQIVTSTFTHTTASGNLKIGGLPFASSHIVVGALQWGGITKASVTDLSCYFPNGVTYCNVTDCGSALAPGLIAAADMPTGGTVRLRGSITYMV
jgi:hypothetical protein